LWLAGNGLRLTILAVPPVLATIRDDLALTATQVGLLSSIPPAMFAIAALAGSLLVAHLGSSTASTRHARRAAGGFSRDVPARGAARPVHPTRAAST